MASPKPLTAFLPLILPHLPQVPEWVATFAVRLAAIEFCERTKCWRHVSAQEITRQNPGVNIPGYAALHEIEHAKLGETELTAIAYTDSMSKRADLGGEPRYITQASDGRLMVLPAPDFRDDQPDMLTISMFLKPKQGRQWTSLADATIDANDSLPDQVFQTHGEAISWGALSRLFMMQEYRDLKQAAIYDAKFRERMDSKAQNAIRGQQRAVLRARLDWC